MRIVQVIGVDRSQPLVEAFTALSGEDLGEGGDTAGSVPCLGQVTDQGCMDGA